MSKKDFTKDMSGGLSSLLGEEPPKPKRGRPNTSTKIVTSTSQEGTKEGETRATFIINMELNEKLKAIAYWDRLTIKEVFNSALEDFIRKYEKSSGEIKPIPKRS